jgi:hypothetical protein
MSRTSEDTIIFKILSECKPKSRHKVIWFVFEGDIECSAAMKPNNLLYIIDIKNISGIKSRPRPV